MSREKLGLTLFWIGTVYMLIAAGVGGWGEPPVVVRANQAFGQAAFFLWAFSVPIGLTVAGIGALLYVGAKGSRIALFGVGIVLTVFLVDMVLRMYLVKTDGHFGSAFGIGGVLILIMFAGLLRLWAEKRKTAQGAQKTVADFQLVGYGFFLLASWFLCGAFGAQFSEGMKSFTPRSPLNTIIYLVLGWLFILLSHYKAVQITE
jgi:hypothetical protein